MAASTRKKTTSKSGSGRGKKSAPPAKRPIRREVTGAVLLVLTLCVAVGYCGVHAIFIDWLAVLLKGLFGYGYWLAAPALLLAGLILLLHRGRPVVLRTVCALLTPLFAGALWHAVFCRTAFESSLGVLPRLWTTGGELACGGVLSAGVQQVDEQKAGVEKFRVPCKSCAEYFHGLHAAARFGEKPGVGEKDAGGGVEGEYFLIPERLFRTGVFRKG